LHGRKFREKATGLTMEDERSTTEGDCPEFFVREQFVELCPADPHNIARFANRICEPFVHVFPHSLEYERTERERACPPINVTYSGRGLIAFFG
jgi:hypothetical protein